ncbi:hypothetical protein pb186bvf_005345 [Paramecium bursaria]
MRVNLEQQQLIKGKLIFGIGKLHQIVNYLLYATTEDNITRSENGQNIYIVLQSNEQNDRLNNNIMKKYSQLALHENKLKKANFQSIFLQELINNYYIQKTLNHDWKLEQMQKLFTIYKSYYKKLIIYKEQEPQENVRENKISMNEMIEKRKEILEIIKQKTEILIKSYDNQTITDKQLSVLYLYQGEVIVNMEAKAFQWINAINNKYKFSEQNQLINYNLGDVIICQLNYSFQHFSSYILIRNRIGLKKIQLIFQQSLEQMTVNLEQTLIIGKLHIIVDYQLHPLIYPEMITNLSSLERIFKNQDEQIQYLQNVKSVNKDKFQMLNKQVAKVKIQYEVSKVGFRNNVKTTN